MMPLLLLSGLTDLLGCFDGELAPLVLPNECLREERPFLPLSRSVCGAKTGKSEFRLELLSFIPADAGANTGAPVYFGSVGNIECR